MKCVYLTYRTLTTVNISPTVNSFEKLIRVSNRALRKCATHKETVVSFDDTYICFKFSMPNEIVICKQASSLLIMMFRPTSFHSSSVTILYNNWQYILYNEDVYEHRRSRGYSNVQLDTKCVVEKPICAVETYILCSNF